MSNYNMRPLLVKISMCTLNTNPLNFRGNRDAIIQSINRSKKLGCVLRVGNELETSGYMCGDHFNEYDTVIHSWQVIGDIIKSGCTQDIVCLIGSSVSHHGNLYNCSIVLHNSKILGIRAKMNIADGDGYYETRWFGMWKERKQIGEFKLPKSIQDITGQTEVPIGEFLLQFRDTIVGLEICEEGWISHNPMIDSSLDGAEIIINPSCSYIQRGKLERKLQMYREGTQRHGGCYVYVNSRGAPGERCYCDGGSIFAENGVIKAVNNLVTLEDVIVTPVIANLTSIRTFRLSNKSFLKSTNGVDTIPRIKIQIDLATCQDNYIYQNPEQKNKVNEMIKQYMIPHATYEPSLFLWDYLRKGKAGGFFLPLSGGLDSCTVALMVYNMCVVVYKQIKQKNRENVLNDLREAIEEPQYNPTSPQQICSKLLFTCYMGTSNSSQETLKRAQNIAKTIGAHFRAINFQPIYEQNVKLCKTSLGIDLKYQKAGGTWRSDLALQNIQARQRMSLSYLMASAELEIPKRKGFLLVLGSANLDQGLRGYYTKYDCSSADLNPIGSFSKLRLKEFLGWNYDLHKFEFIQDILNATPTAELRPLKEGQIAQTDEEDMGLTYAELALFGNLRRVEKHGPVSMFNFIISAGISGQSPKNLSEKIKHFFRSYGKNRHKMTTLTASLHYNPESCDDHRMDQRPIMYQTDWSYQFEAIDERVKELENQGIEKVL